MYNVVEYRYTRAIQTYTHSDGCFRITYRSLFALQSATIFSTSSNCASSPGKSASDYHVNTHINTYSIYVQTHLPSSPAHLELADFEEPDDVLHDVRGQLHGQTLHLNLGGRAVAVLHPSDVDEQTLPRGNEPRAHIALGNHS